MPGDSLLTDWILYALGLLGLGGGGGITGYVRRVDTKAESALDKAEENARRLEGDDHDDGYEGLMGIAKDTRERVALLEEKMDTARRERKHEHEAVMDHLEEIEGDGEHAG